VIYGISVSETRCLFLRPIAIFFVGELQGASEFKAWSYVTDPTDRSVYPIAMFISYISTLFDRVKEEGTPANLLAKVIADCRDEYKKALNPTL